MRRPVHHLCRSVAVVALGSGLVVGCSAGSDLDPTQRAEAETLIDELATTGMIELSDEDRTCAAGAVSIAEFEALRADPPELQAAAEAVVACVGENVIGASVLESQAGSVSPTSLECAVDELDRRFIVDLVAGLMAETPPQVQAEIEVARALSLCLELDELLRQ